MNSRSNFFSKKNPLKVLMLLVVFIMSGGFVNLMMGPGIDSPTPIGSFLNGNLPSLTPGDGNNIQWSIEPSFPNLRFNSPLVITPHPQENRIFVASRDGLIEHFENNQNTSSKQTLIDLRNETAVVWDGGFLGLAFHPEFGMAGSPNRNYFYVYYTAKGPNGEFGGLSCNNTCFSCENNANFFGSYLRLERYSVNEGTLTGNKNTRQQLFNVRQFNGTHRGGGLHFGQDGFLYLAIGDQARRVTAQNLVTNFEGGVIRLDVNQAGGNISHAPRRKMGVHVGENDEFTGNGYYIPNDNPWLDTNNGLFEEFVSNGHRNPHRMTKDRLTGEFWIGEIGAGSREEITKLEIGGNAGWPIYEGNRFRQFTACGSNNLPMGVGDYNPPVVDFLRSEANAIIGGYVYRGSKFPSLYGQYLCGGYSQNRLFRIEDTGGGNYSKTNFANFTPGRIITFGEGPDAELHMGRQADNTTLYQLKATGANPPAPQLLSQTGAFSNLNNLTPSPGVIPYDMIEPFWSDGADKNRWMAIPNDGTHNTIAEKIQFSADGNWVFPNGAVLIKHFELSGRRLETRFEVKSASGEYYYLTYRWNSAGTDATLLIGGLNETINVNGQTQIWHYPSVSECLNCHQQAAGNVLGPKTRNLNSNITYPTTGINANQLVTLSHLGILTENITDANSSNYMAVAAKDDLSASLEYRARSYMDVNCSYCHQPGTGNRAQFDMRITTALNQQDLINGDIIVPLDLNNPQVIVPQNTNRSMVHHRMNSLLPGVTMPPLAKNVVDDEGLQLIADWINSICPSGSAGDACDDGNSNTRDDKYDANCNCVGIPICTGYDTPTATVTTNNPSVSTASDGSIIFTFTNDAVDGGTRTNIEFSIDGGANYPYNALDNAGSITANNLSNGTYNLWVRWGNGQCARFLQNVTLTSNCPDSDNDGVCDADDICAGGNDNVDTDGDGVPDFCDDCNTGTACNDGNPCTTGDTFNASCNCVGTFQDADGDGVCDANDICPGGNDNIDSDDDGIPDACDDGGNTGGGGTLTGNTGNEDCIGPWIDSDNDGICDAADICEGADDFLDTNLNGIPDGCEGGSNTGGGGGTLTGNTGIEDCPIPWLDTDGDGVCNAADICEGADDYLDTNLNGIPDGCEDGGNTGGGGGTLTGNTGNEDCPIPWLDTDGDGVCNAADICEGADDYLDTNLNGIPDGCEGGGNTGGGTNPTYCSSVGLNTTYEYIESVEFGSLNNVSGNNGGYGDFTSQSVSVALGASIPVTLTPGLPQGDYLEYWKIWIDFNQDGDFEDAGEEAFLGSAYAAATTGTVSIPTSATLGSTRMRISMRWNADMTPCTDLAYGEVEDYTVTISNAVNEEDQVLSRIVKPIASMDLFPNPVRDFLNIELQNISSNGVIEVYDNLGKLIITKNASAQDLNILLKTNKLDSGIYIVMFKMPNEKPLIKRFIKKHY